jgi:HPt (histidine-containing phosphotransfer) domain-containing protein
MTYRLSVHSCGAPRPLDGCCPSSHWLGARRRGIVRGRKTPFSLPAVDLIDKALLAELGDMLGPRLDTVIETFVGHLSTYLGDIQQAVAAGDLTAVRAVAHKLKGGAGAIGATQLSDAAAALERAAADGVTDRVPALAATIPALAQATVAALREH